MFLQILHAVITLSTIGLPYILPKGYLLYYLIYIVLTFMSWHYLDGDCIFTILEDQKDEHGNAVDNSKSFVLSKLKSFGIDPSNKFIHYFLDSILYFSILVAFYRYGETKGLGIGILLLIFWIYVNGGYLNKWIH